MLLLALWAARQWINRQLIVSDHPLYRPMAAFLFLVVLQWVTGTTAYRQVTYSHLLLYAAYGMLRFVATQTLRRSSQFELLATVHRVRRAGGFVCHAAGSGAQRKTLLDLGLGAGGLDLWPLRKSQSLCGSNGGC